MANARIPGEEKRILFDAKHIRLAARGKWEYAERKNLSGIVGIIAMTDARKMILVEQFRPPVQKRVIELPAGLAGDIVGSEDEALEIAARRELMEETGYEAAGMTRLVEGAVSAGMCDEIVTLFHATGLKKTGTGGGDASEDIEVHEIPIDEVHDWILKREKTGATVDLKIYAGLFFLKCE